jgi:L-asparaginase II
MISDYKPVVELTRGSIVESIHFGAIAVVNTQGELVASYGNPGTITFLRSSAKPFQALPFVERGGDRSFNLTDREVAIMCASHSGTDEQVEVLRGMQAKVGVREQDLMCGTHIPSHQETARAMILRGEEPTPIRHNCSGKHTGMLAHARLRNLPLENYISRDHPIQKTILKTFAEMCGLPEDQIVVGTDGCSAPNFAVPLRNAALAYARLCDPVQLLPERTAACQRIVHALTGNADMVGGPGRFDTILMGATQGRILSKGGAEGYQGIGIMPGSLGAGFPALGIAIKISDGDSGGRAISLTTIEVLRQLGVLSKQETSELSRFDTRPLYNYRKLVVGEIHPSFILERVAEHS